jgi:DNA-binding MarR family transcriptional regulator
MTHPTNRIQDEVHQRVRLGILAILNNAARADFGYLRDTLGVSDGNLGRHIKVLEDAGLVATKKVFEQGRPRTWITITRKGRAAFRDELAALRDLIAAAELPESGDKVRTLRPADGLGG